MLPQTLGKLFSDDSSGTDILDCALEELYGCVSDPDAVTARTGAYATARLQPAFKRDRFA
jgi:hypothetical protein